MQRYLNFEALFVISCELELNLVSFMDLLVCGIVREFKFDRRILEFGSIEAFKVAENPKIMVINKFTNLFGFILHYPYYELKFQI